LEKEDGGYGQATYVWKEIADSSKGSVQETIKTTLDVLNDLPLASMICDSAGLILGLNDLSEELFGYSPSDLIQKSLSVLMPKHSAQDDNLINEFLKSTSKRSSTTVLKQFQTKEGSIKNLRVATSERVQAGTRFLLLTFAK